MLEALKALVFAFDTDAGLPQSVYEATSELVLHVLGEAAANRFFFYIKVNHGKFHLQTGRGCFRVLE